MLYKQAKKCRQSPLEKATHYAENAARFVGTVKSIYDIGKTVYSGIQAVAPYAQAAMTALM